MCNHEYSYIPNVISRIDNGDTDQKFSLRDKTIAIKVRW